MAHDARATRDASYEPALSRARWRSAAFEVARDAMLILDESGTCVDANYAGRQLLRAGAAGLVGRRIDEFAELDASEGHARRWASFLVEGYDEGECELQRADGSHVRVEFTLTARVESDRHLVILRDAAEGSAAEAARLKAQFVASINHQLRTPLNGVVGATDLLAGTELNGEQRECVDLLRASGDALTTAIEDIMDFSRIEAGIVDLGPSGPSAVTPGDDPPAAEDDAPDGSEKVVPPRVGRRVLVVEDDQSSRLVAVRLMEARGLEVDAAENGHEALEALQNATYDAIFMDCEMSGLDGYQTTREIRGREGAGRHTPIIAMTASTLPGDAERCHAAGMDFYVAKPIRPAGLDYILAHAISDREV